MDLRSGQRVQAQQRTDSAAPMLSSEPARPSRGGRNSGQGKFSKRNVLIGGLVTLLVVGALVTAFWFTGAGSLGAVKRDQYQAIFLTNGQVYFGKINSITADVVTLEDIYYLQQQGNVQDQDSETQTQQNQLSLAKLGNELHGPEDTMYIERSQVLFWENIKNEGEVVKTIQQEKQQNQNQ